MAARGQGRREKSEVRNVAAAMTLRLQASAGGAAEAVRLIIAAARVTQIACIEACRRAVIVLRERLVLRRRTDHGRRDETQQDHLHNIGTRTGVITICMFMLSISLVYRLWLRLSGMVRVESRTLTSVARRCPPRVLNMTGIGARYVRSRGGAQQCSHAALATWHVV
jgi:hypothetical protein